MYRLLVNDIPVGTNSSAGQSIKSLVSMDSDESATVIYSIYRDTDAKYVLFTTKNGLVKKTSLDEYIKTKKKTGIAAITIREDDELVSVSLVKDEDVIDTDLTTEAEKYNLFNGLALWDTNHICNKYTIAQLNTKKSSVKVSTLSIKK
jgi:DNA gyrase/topoisomerase IV subunit A